MNLQDPSSTLTRWAAKLSEYDYTVEHRQGTRMRHADALSRIVNRVEKDLNWSREVIREEQDKDYVCKKYKHYENFWTNKDGMLYYERLKGQPRVVIPKTLVSTVLTSYHDLPFTAHQEVCRTMEFISKKYWWDTMRQDVIMLIKVCED